MFDQTTHPSKPLAHGKRAFPHVIQIAFPPELTRMWPISFVNPPRKNAQQSGSNARTSGTRDTGHYVCLHCKLLRIRSWTS